jgi:hypothetical protein
MLLSNRRDLQDRVCRTGVEEQFVSKRSECAELLGKGRGANGSSRDQTLKAKSWCCGGGRGQGELWHIGEGWGCQVCSKYLYVEGF